MKLNEGIYEAYTGELDAGFDILSLLNTGNKGLCPHEHPYHEVYHLIKGNVAYRTSNGIRLLSAGDVIFINKDELHCPVVLNPDEEYEQVVLHISPDTLKRLSSDKIDLAECFHLYSNKVFCFPDYVQNAIRTIQKNIVALKQTKPSGYELLADAYLTELFVIIHQQINNSDTVLPQNELKPSHTLRVVKRYIIENLDQDISIDDIADFVCISKYHFMRTFKKLTGQTVYQYIINKRLESAERLIKSGVDATRAGQMCGFKDYSCFYRAFMNKYQIAPRVFSRMNARG